MGSKKQKQMDSKELRIGNLINDNGLVESVVVEHLINDEYYDGLKGCKPIPLTEECLIKFGFSKINGKHIEAWELIGSPFTWSKDCLNIGNGMSITNIKHVHQLQNLYFALTGEELTIKDNETHI